MSKHIYDYLLFSRLKIKSQNAYITLHREVILKRFLIMIFLPSIDQKEKIDHI